MSGGKKGAYEGSYMERLANHANMRLSQRQNWEQRRKIKDFAQWQTS